MNKKVGFNLLAGNTYSSLSFFLNLLDEYSKLYRNLGFIILFELISVNFQYVQLFILEFQYFK